MKKTFLICEKPNAAKKIAVALAENKVKQVKSEFGVDYFEFKRDGKIHLAVPAVGHLFGLKDDSGKGWTYPIFKTQWLPTYEINNKAAFARKYLKTFESLVSDDFEYVVATDLDEEGSVIGYNILRFLCNKEKAKRMCFSTLTKPDLVKSYGLMKDSLDVGRVESGLTRHKLDFLYGINTTRALTLSIKHAGKKLNYYVVSAGRVQTPMLYFLIKREKKIAKFKPEPYWEVEAPLKTKPQLTCSHKNNKFWEKSEVEKIKKRCENKKAILKNKKSRKSKKKPPLPFNLTSLQTEAYKLFGYSPKRTLDIAQSLYSNGYISYPRTSSQKLPPQIGYKEIFDSLKNLKNYKQLVEKLLENEELIPREGKKKDSAHPAIYPTTEPPKLSKLKSTEKRVYDLVVRRFLSVFGKPAVRETIKLVFEINGEPFVATGGRILEKEWIEYYGKYARFKEVTLPPIEKGDKFSAKVNILDKETQPPSRYSQGSILKELEKRGIGTKATRAQILQILYDRNYIQDKSIKVTELGLKVGETLAKYVPELVSEELTRNFEESMEKVYAGEKAREQVIEEASQLLKNIAKEFKKNEKKIGERLEKGVLETKEKQSILGKCSKCDGGMLKILYSPRTKNHFVGCTNYPECKNIYPLPGRALIKKTGKFCEHCNTPIVKVIRKARRPFTMCLDTKCKTKESWGKKKKRTKKKPKKKSKQ